MRSLQIMKSKLLIVADLGLVKAYKLDFTPNHTPRLEQLEEIVLEEAHSRLLDKLTDEAGRHSSPTQKNWGAPLADDYNFKARVQTSSHRPDFRPHPATHRAQRLGRLLVSRTQGNQPEDS